MSSIFYYLRVSLVVILFSAFFSCEFKPDGTYFNEIIPEYPTSVEISIDDFEDTIFVHQQGININLDYSSLQRKVKTATAYINDSEIGASLNYTNKVTVYLSTAAYISGYYFLNVKLAVHSGTGSLLDKLDAEFFEVEYQIPVFIDKEPPSTVKILSAKEENGFLKIDWEMYKRSNFSHYVLERKFINGQDSSGALYYIYDRYQTSLVDSFFMGANSNYRIRVHDLNRRVAYGPRYEVSDLYNPDINFQIDANNHAVISWNPTPFTKNYLRTTIHETQYVRHDFYDVAMKSYTTNHEIEFGQHSNYTIEYQAKNNSYPYRWESYDATVYHGEKINDHILDADYNPYTDSYFFVESEGPSAEREVYLKEIGLYEDNEIKKLLVNTGDYRAHDAIDFFQSTNGALMYFINTESNILYKLNPLSLQVEKQSSLSEILGESDLSIQPKSTEVSDNGILKIYDNVKKQVSIIDLTKEEKLLSIDGNHTISEDGKYLAGGQSVYDLHEDGSISLRFNTYKGVMTINTELNYVMVQMYLTLCFYDLATGDLIKRDDKVSYSWNDRHGGLVLVYSNTYGQGIIDTKKSFDWTIEIARLDNVKYNVKNNMLITQTNTYQKITTALIIQ